MNCLFDKCYRNGLALPTTNASAWCLVIISLLLLFLCFFICFY